MAGFGCHQPRGISATLGYQSIGQYCYQFASTGKHPEKEDELIYAQWFSNLPVVAILPMQAKFYELYLPLAN